MTPLIWRAWMEAHRDRALLESVRQRIMEDSRLAGQSINVTSSGGYIQLVGTVDSEENKMLAEELARGVMGVRHVDDRLEVHSSEAA
jgi:osmotically-inducible protein OsmY